MWKQKRNLIILVSFLILIVLATSYFIYKKWQQNKVKEAGRIQRETILRDLVTIPYDENRPPQDLKTIKNALLNLGINKNEAPMAEADRQEVLNVLIQAPKTIPNE